MMRVDRITNLLRMFLRSESGLVQSQQRSLPIAWVAGVMAGAAVVLSGTPQKVFAAVCDGPIGCPGSFLNGRCTDGASCNTTVCGGQPAEWRHKGNSPAPEDVFCCCLQ